MKEKILEAYKTYIKGTKALQNGEFSQWYGAKDSVSVNIMHDAIREELLEVVKGKNLKIMTTNNGGEYKLETEIHTKKIDIAIVDKDTEEIIVAISFKMPLSSVGRNLSTMSEGNIGDTALIKDAGIPMFYVMFTDAFPITKKNDKFAIEKFSDAMKKMFSEKMIKPRTNKYRSDGIFVCVVDFKDEEIKKELTTKKLNFASQIDRKNVAEQHLKALEKIDHNDIEILTLHKNGELVDDFDDSLRIFKDMIKLEINLWEIRKDYF